MPDTILLANPIFPYTPYAFPMGKPLKCSVDYSSFPNLLWSQTTHACF